MIDSVLILPDMDNGDGLLARRNGASVETSRGDVSALAPLLGMRAALVLPGQRVRAFLTDIPERIKGAERISVARFAHEDALAATPSDLHVVVGAADPAPTLVVGTDVMDALLAHFDPQMVLADFDALAGLAGQDLRLLDRIVTPGPQGQAVDPDWAESAPTVLDDETLARAIFERIDSGDALNLRTGAFRRRIALQAGPWSRVAAVALACVLLGLGVVLSESRAATAQATELRDQARTIYSQATGQPAPDNLARLARTAPLPDSDPTAFLALSDLLFRAMADHPDITVERLSFEMREDVLRLRLVYPGFEAAEALEGSVAALGGAFTPGGVREQNGRFVGDAALSLGEAS